MADIREITSNPPITFLSTGDDLLDWSVTGAVGGVGKPSPNVYPPINDNSINRGYWGIYPDGGLYGEPCFNTTEAWRPLCNPVYLDVGTYTFSVYIKADVALEPAAGSPYSDYPVVLYWQGQADWPHYDQSATVEGSAKYIGVSTAFKRNELTFTVTSPGYVFPYVQRRNIDVVNIYTTCFQLEKAASASSYITYGKYYLPLSISSTGAGIREINIVLDAPLQAGTTVSLASTGIAIPTYYGRNTLDCDTDVPPTIYIKFRELEPVTMWAEERPAQVSLYDITEPQNGFDHNGIAVLMPSELISNKEDKGRWDIEMIHPIDEYGKWTYITCQNVVKVNSQLYRIDVTETCIDANSEYVSAHAKHITYDMADDYIEEAVFLAGNGEDYITQLNAHKVREFPNQQHVVGAYTFDITSDLEGEMECQIQDQSIIESIFGADNSLVNRYGGEVYRNNFHISVNKAMEGAPEGNAFALRYGTDLTKISFKIDMSEWVTNLICVDNYGNMAGIWWEGIDWIMHHHKTRRVHFTYSDHAQNMAHMYDGTEWDNPPGSITDDMARLITDLLSYWDTVNTPSVSIVVSVANIKGDPKYKDYLNLQNFDVGYKGTIYVEHLGINVEMKIVSIRRNELTGEAIQIVLGNTRRSLIRQTVMSGTIVSPNSVEGKNTANNQSMQQELYDTQTIIMGKDIAGMELFSIAELERRTISQLEG